jgi:hypothetical protein
MSILIAALAALVLLASLPSQSTKPAGTAVTAPFPGPVDDVIPPLGL